jgi:signal transduction histidine kinase
MRLHTVAVGLAAVGVVALGTVALLTGHVRSGSSPGLAALTIAAGVSCVISGLAARARRGEHRTGALMVGMGFVVMASALVQADRSLPFTVGLAVSALPAAMLVHLVLAFPRGRLASGAERVVVVAAYLTATVGHVAMLMFMSLDNLGSCPCPENLLLARADMDVHTALMAAERAAGATIAVVVVLLLARRWRGASAPLRRALAPVLITGGVAGALLGVVLIGAVPPYTSVPTGVQATARVAFAAVPIAYLLGLFRARMDRVAVSDFVIEISRGLEAGRLRGALARALRDPSLQLGYWLRATGGYADADGRPVSVTPTAGRSVTYLDRHGRKVAALVHDSGLSEAPELLDAVAGAAGLALENERLLAELRAQLGEITVSRARLVDAGNSERRRLERNLHDGAQQRLVTLALHIRMAQESLPSGPAATRAFLADTGEDLKHALAELRELAHGLHPAILTDRGLTPALQSLAHRSPLPVQISGVPAHRLPEAVEVGIYYVVAETLTNTAKHAAASRVRIELSEAEGTVVVEINDDGRGGATAMGGSGIRGLSDRVEALGGRFVLDSPALQGTRTRVELPLG